MHSEREKKLLSRLLDRYENSRTYKQENLRNQSFSVKPEQIFPEYHSDYASVQEIADFEDELDRLEKENLIQIKKRKGSIIRIDMNRDTLPRYYEILDRTDKNRRINWEIDFYRSFLHENSVIAGFAEDQICRLENGKKAEYSVDESVVLINLLRRILCNQSELLERELSILVCKDSKSFEKNYRSKICRILQKYSRNCLLPEYIEKEREKEKLILEEYHVYPNPSFVYLKGNVEIIFEDGEEGEYYLPLKPDFPMAVSSDSLKQVKSIRTKDRRLMTIENLTSFNRVQENDCLHVYLGGYHNTVKRQFLEKIAADNSNISFIHFGDIDPDGFCILEDLRHSTGIDFKPYRMGIEEMQLCSESCKALEKQDIVKAHTLLTKGKYTEIMEYMLEHNQKLEQEIISIR